MSTDSALELFYEGSVDAEWTEAGENVHYSASQIETFERCNLKWWWKYPGGFEVPETQSQIYGKELHAELEGWIDNGAVPQDPRAAEALRHFREEGVERGEHLISEREFRRPLHIPGREMVGFVDVTYLKNTHKPRVWDFKSSSDVVRYMKTDYQLVENTQLNLYAYDTLQALAPRAAVIEVAHLYIQTRGKVRSELVTVDLDRKSVETRWSNYLKIVDTMEQVRREVDPNRVPHNEMACNDYGGCPHRVRCNATIFGATSFMPDAQREAVTSARALMSSREVLMLNPPDSTRRLEGAPPATPNTVDPDTLPKAFQDAAHKAQATKGNIMTNPLEALAALGAGKTAVEANPIGAMASLAQKLAGITASIAPPIAPSAPTLAEMQAAVAAEMARIAALERSAEIEKARATAAEIVAVASEAADRAIEAERLAHEAAMRAKKEEDERARPSAPPAFVPSTREALDKLTAAHPEPPKKSPGRPRKVKDFAGEGATVVRPAGPAKSEFGHEEPDAPEQPPTPSDPVPSPVGPGDLMFLLIDTVPVFGFPQGPLHLGKWLEPILEAIKRDTGAPWQFHEFRKAAAVLCKYTEAATLPEALIVDSNADEWKPLQSYLINKARCILRGTR